MAPFDGRRPFPRPDQPRCRDEIVMRGRRHPRVRRKSRPPRLREKHRPSHPAFRATLVKLGTSENVPQFSDGTLTMERLLLINILFFASPLSVAAKRNSTSTNVDAKSAYRLISLGNRCPGSVPRNVGVHPTFIRLGKDISGKRGRCYFRLATSSSYGLAAFIEQMDFDCGKGEYLQFKTTLPGIWKPTRVFSDRLCGRFNSTNHDLLVKGSDGLHLWQFFNESSPHLEIEYSADFGGNFLIVLTPTRPDCTGITDSFSRCGSGYCVPTSVLCDGHVNCMERPGHEADDERRRECLGSLTKSFSSSSKR
jgi:hypothetical protein